MYGDGWNTASFNLYSLTRGELTQTNVSVNPTVVKKCFDPIVHEDGDSFVASVTGFQTRQTWEVS